jgi:hypothetical protein
MGRKNYPRVSGVGQTSSEGYKTIMPRAGFIKEDARKHYWGIKRGRIDIVRDDNGNWHGTDEVYYTTFDIDRVPILLLRFTPYCPECLEVTFKGFLNYEVDPTGEQGIAFRCFYHFWYHESQLWEGPPKMIKIPMSSYTPGPLIPGAQEVIEKGFGLPSLQVPVVNDDAAYNLGAEAFKTGVKVWNNPFDGRTTQGRSWVRGWEVAQDLGHRNS